MSDLNDPRHPQSPYNPNNHYSPYSKNNPASPFYDQNNGGSPAFYAVAILVLVIGLVRGFIQVLLDQWLIP